MSIEVFVSFLMYLEEELQAKMLFRERTERKGWDVGRGDAIAMFLAGFAQASAQSLRHCWANMDTAAHGCALVWDSTQNRVYLFPMRVTALVASGILVMFYW